MTTTTKIRPVHSIRMGRIEAAIWRNEADKKVRHNVTFTRSYGVETDGSSLGDQPIASDGMTF